MFFYNYFIRLVDLANHLWPSLIIKIWAQGY